MLAPRIEVDLEKIYHNACTLVERLAARGISVTGITKATLGSPEIARTLLRAGVTALGDSRIENIERLRAADIQAPMMLIRTPMLSQVHRVVQHSDVSFNSELDVINNLSVAAEVAKRNHGVVLMVELGDLREGIMPAQLTSAVRRTLRFPSIVLRGIGTNLACQNGVCPDQTNMAELSTLATGLQSSFDQPIDIVSGGNSANLNWALDSPDTGAINNLRLGESILLGRETSQRQPIDGLHTDAFTLIAEVIESKEKPSMPWGEVAQNAFGEQPCPIVRKSDSQTILAVGRQDIDPTGIYPPEGVDILGVSSDHLIVACDDRKYPLGSELEFQLNYSALVRAMTSIFVAKVFKQ